MTDQPVDPQHPHRGQPVLAAGEPLESARAAMILLHGRGTTADSILSLVRDLDRPGFAYLAPQAAGYTWYPHRFLAPLDRNEPFLSSALAVIGGVLDRLAAANIPPERALLLGFSQGACLVLEYAARRARRYGGVVGFSGGLIGSDDAPRDYPGSLEGTPVFIGCSDRDPHVPAARVDLSAEVLDRLGATVDKRFYPGMGHAINSDEIEAARVMMDAVLEQA